MNRVLRACEFLYIMGEDQFTDFEKAEYYQQWLKTAKNRTVFFAILFFIPGFVLARAIYLLPV